MKESRIYRNMTQTELAEAYDVFKTIPDPMGFIASRRQLADKIREKLAPVSDIAYGPESVQKLDIYAPENAKSLPVVLDIHGGGWCMGSKEPNAIAAKVAVANKILWVSIDYGLAPDYGMSKIASHVQQAISWTYKNIAQYGGNPNRIIVHGNSAGGHLAAAMLIPGWQNDYDIPEDVVKGLIAVSGNLDLEAIFHGNAMSQQALNMTLEEAQAFSPILNPPKTPLPCLLAYGGNELDAYKSDSQRYAAVLKSAGCHVELVEIPGENHFTVINALANKDWEFSRKLLKFVLGESIHG